MAKRPKMVPLHQIMEVDTVQNEFRVVGVVIYSNFLPEGFQHNFPIHDDVAKKIKKGDKLKITHFATEDDIYQGENKITFKNKGTRYEIWNTQNEGWDKVWEYFPESEE